MLDLIQWIALLKALPMKASALYYNLLLDPPIAYIRNLHNVTSYKLLQSCRLPKLIILKHICRPKFCHINHLNCKATRLILPGVLLTQSQTPENEISTCTISITSPKFEANFMHCSWHSP